jgi:hypothetical protein
VSKREQIMAAVVTALAGTTGVGSRIFRSREDALAAAESPSLLVMPESEDPSELTIGYVEKRLRISVGVYARAVSSPDSAADATAQSVHAKLLADPTLGGLAVDLSEGATDWDFDQADQTSVMVNMRFVVWYRHARNSLA